MSELSRDEEKVFIELNEHILGLFVHENKSAEEIEAMLVSQGMEREFAVNMIKLAKDQIDEITLEVEQKQAKKDMKQGLVWFVGGLIITIASYASAGLGEKYYITWGAMFYGLYKITVGMMKYFKLRNK